MTDRPKSDHAGTPRAPAKGPAEIGAKPLPKAAEPKAPPAKAPPAKVPEIGGPSGPEPTRYGDWERKGICVDF